MITKKDLERIIVGLEELRKNNKADIRESQIYVLTSLNNSLSAINKYFFSLATVLIPIVAGLAGFKEVRINLEDVERVALAESIILILLSISCGFLHMLYDIEFFRFWLKNADERLKLWSSSSFYPGNPLKAKDYVEEYENIKNRTDQLQDLREKESTTFPLFLQGLFLSLAILLIAFAGFRLIF